MFHAALANTPPDAMLGLDREYCSVQQDVVHRRMHGHVDASARKQNLIDSVQSVLTYIVRQAKYIYYSQNP